MRYDSVVQAIFVSRPNRFIARVLLDGQEQTVHVKNTGRCRELLVPGCTVWLSRASNPQRKTAFDLVAAEKNLPDGFVLLVNLDSQIPNDVAAEWLPRSGLFSPDAVFRREVTFGGSRFDFFVEDGNRKAFLEVKGCTLERDGICSFPDAPTVRGARHVKELTQVLEKGYEAFVLFIVQMKGMRYLIPNDVTDPQFGQNLRAAAEAGVRVLAVECEVSPDAITACRTLPIHLELEQK